MNVCCGAAFDNNIDLTKREYDEVLLNIEKTTLKFNEPKGIFMISEILDENHPLNKKKSEIEDLKSQIKKKKLEIKDYKSKIEELNEKLETMSKILLIDEKEQQYIHFLGQNNE